MDISLNAKLTQQGIILLLALIIIAFIATVLLVVVQNKASSSATPDAPHSKKYLGIAKVTLWAILIIVSTLALSILASYIYDGLPPIFADDPFATDSPPSSASIVASAAPPTDTPTPSPTPGPSPEPSPTLTPGPAPSSTPKPTSAPPSAKPASAPPSTPVSTPTPEPSPPSIPVLETPPPSTPTLELPFIPPPTQSVDSLTVSASYQYVSFADANAIIQAETSAAATRVIMSWSNMDGSSYSRPMRSQDNVNWIFFADFYEPGTFIITITAYDANGQTASTIISVPSPVT